MHGMSGMGVMGIGGPAGWCLHRMARMRVVRHDSVSLLGMAGVRIVLRSLGGGSRCMTCVWIRSLRHRMGCRVHVCGVVGRHARLIGGAGQRIVACMRVGRHDSTSLVGMTGVRVVLRCFGGGY
jgi:hypothetical protein